MSWAAPIVSARGPLDRMSAAIVGGCGHVGLPLAISLAEVGIPTVSFDVDESAVACVNSGRLPFHEDGAEAVLARTLEDGSFRASADPSVIADVDIVIVVIGTPVDEHMNPDPNAVVAAIEECRPFMNASQLVVLRSTVFPGVTRRVEEMLKFEGLDVDVCFCPERILEGRAMTELRELPQIVGARNDVAAERASELFHALGVKTIRTLPEEAELAKLFTNTWRYIKFAAANQFWVMANEAGLDFANIRAAIAEDYPRAADLPGAGFAAGPCLFKDTMQLAAFMNNNFLLGHSAMMVNEGQPMYIVDRLSESYDLGQMRVGVLGMAFKADSDDTRSSLSYKLKRILRFRAREVLTTDPHVTSDPTLMPLEEVLDRADLLIIGAPHAAYRSIQTEKPVVDVWNLLGNGTRV